MYVCICSKVTDKQIHKAAENGALTLECLNKKLNLGTCCGKCHNCARKILSEALLNNWQANMQGKLAAESA